MKTNQHNHKQIVPYPTLAFNFSLDKFLSVFETRITNFFLAFGSETFILRNLFQKYNTWNCIHTIVKTEFITLKPRWMRVEESNCNSCSFDRKLSSECKIYLVSYATFSIGVFFLFIIDIIHVCFHWHPEMQYRKPPTISPGLIYFRKRFLMGLYKGGAYIRVGLYMDDLLC